MEQTNFFFLYLSYLVKPPEKLVKGVHQLRRRQFFRQRSKVDDVSVQNAEKMDLSCTGFAPTKFRDRKY